MTEYSFTKIVKNDPNVLSCIVVALVCLVLGLEVYFVGYDISKREGLHFVAQEDRFGEALFYCALAAAALVYAAYRFSLVTDLFDNGIECAGVIDKIEGQQIFFSFDYRGGERCSKKIGLGWGAKNILHAGDGVTVLCSRYDFEKAIIQDFYL